MICITLMIIQFYRLLPMKHYIENYSVLEDSDDDVLNFGILSPTSFWQRPTTLKITQFP